MARLTEEEIREARHARNFTVGWVRYEGNTPLDCPAAAVARHRGCYFKEVESTARPGLSFGQCQDFRILNAACDDVAEWLGFASFREYAEALFAERERIFDRATY